MNRALRTVGGRVPLVFARSPMARGRLFLGI